MEGDTGVNGRTHQDGVSHIVGREIGGPSDATAQRERANLFSGPGGKGRDIMYDPTAADMVAGGQPCMSLTVEERRQVRPPGRIIIMYGGPFMLSCSTWRPLSVRVPLLPVHVWMYVRPRHPLHHTNTLSAARVHSYSIPVRAHEACDSPPFTFRVLTIIRGVSSAYPLSRPPSHPHPRFTLPTY